MTPTLSGRIQTRLFLICTAGVAWTLLLAPVLPRGGDLRGLYRTLLEALVWFVLAGCLLWEPLYHGLQQFRWEKDWPIVFGLLTFFHEAALVWILLGLPRTAGWTFTIHAITAWLAMWLIANGPLRFVFVRWRYRGGRLTEASPW